MKVNIDILGHPFDVEFSYTILQAENREELLACEFDVHDIVLLDWQHKPLACPDWLREMIKEELLSENGPAYEAIREDQ